MKRHSSNNNSKQDKQNRPQFQRNRLDNDRNFSDDYYWTGNPYGNAQDSDWLNGTRYDPRYDDIYIPPNRQSPLSHDVPYNENIYGIQTPLTNKGRPDYEPSHFGKGPKGYRRTDDRIKEEVCEMLARSQRIDASDIDVDVDDGCVILSGFVESRDMRHSAERLVERISGVEDVRNDIKIKKPRN